ncbi:peptidase M26, partial [Streptococcus sp. KR]
MNFKTSGEKRQNFSLRKLAVGLVSVAVACFFLMGTGLQTVSAQESHAVNYTYVLESDLTDEEKTLLVTSLPQVAEESDATYYLVYRANQVLPNTGTSSSLGTVALVAGLSLLIVVVLKGRDGKSKISRFLLVSALGSQLLSPTALALTSETLAAYNTQLSVQAGDALPAPVDIPGYTYIGYVKNKVDVVKQSDKQKAHDSKSNLENVGSSTIEEQQGGTPSPIESQLQKNNETVVQAKGSQEPGHEGDALVQPVQPTYTEPVSTQGTQESGHEGEALVQPVQPAYTAPISTQGTQESGHEGESLIQAEQPSYTAPISTKGTQEPGHEGDALVQPTQPAYTAPISTQGTQESGHEGEALVQPAQPSYTAPISTQGTQESGHEGDALVQPVQPTYTEPVSTQG